MERDYFQLSSSVGGAWVCGFPEVCGCFWGGVRTRKRGEETGKWEGKGEREGAGEGKGEGKGTARSVGNDIGTCSRSRMQ